MKKNIIIILLIFISQVVLYAQTKRPKFTEDVKQDVYNFLPVGKYRFDMLGTKTTNQQKDIMLRFQQGVQKNIDWFTKYSETSPKPMPYHKNFGITKAEYKEILTMNSKLVPVASDNVQIKKQGNSIIFTTGDTLKTLEYIQIDPIKNQVIVNGVVCEYEKKKIIVGSGADTGLGSGWKGHSWKFQSPANLTAEDVKNPKIAIKNYSFTVAQLDTNGKTFINVVVTEMENGAKVIDLDLAVVF